MINLLEVKNLKIAFKMGDKALTAVNNLSFSIKKGETVGMIGESGCGKTVTALSIMRLLQEPPALVENGEIVFRGKDILKLSELEMQKLRGKEMSMIFQEPMTSLNPVFTAGYQVAEVFMVHCGMKKKEAFDKAEEIFNKVGIPNPKSRLKDYPHQLSGGLRQRVMIAAALALNPDLLIADEPTTALDVTIQAQILELLMKLQEEFKMSVLFITHDIGIVADTCRKMLVMYAGKPVEYGSTKDIFANPLHPYTQGLFQCLPKLGLKKLNPIQGMVPDLSLLPEGCPFQERCPYTFDKCRKMEPLLISKNNRQGTACFKVNNE